MTQTLTTAKGERIYVQPINGGFRILVTKATGEIVKYGEILPTLDQANAAGVGYYLDSQKEG